MSDFDRFVEFVRREGAGYNEPPEAPGKAMWGGVEARLTGADPVDKMAAATAIGVSGAMNKADHEPLEARGYNDPPSEPREDMWERIETAWAVRESNGAPNGEFGGRVAFGRPAVGPWLERHRVVGWVVGLAAAASLVLGIVLDRDAGLAQPGETGIAPSGSTVVAEPGTEVAVPPLALAEARPAPLGEVPEPEPQVVVASVVPSASLVVEPGTVAAQGESGEFVERVAEDTPSERSVVLPSPVRSRQDYTTTRHLDRTATLLTAFRIDQRSPASEQDLAIWARGLLVDTRMHLDMPVNRSPLERALLQDLELVLLQISRLGPGAPDFEWQLARESMEWKGTLMRVRAASAEGET